MSDDDRIYSERRSTPRYALEVKLSYRLRLPGGAMQEGVGFTVDFSRNGVGLVADTKLCQGCSIQLLVAWPVVVEGAPPRQLQIIGSVSRSDGLRAAISITSYRFAAVAKARPSGKRCAAGEGDIDADIDGSQ